MTIRTNIRRGTLLRRGHTTLRVTRIRGDQLWAQVREGRVGRFTEGSQEFSLAQVAKNYSEVQ